MFDCKVIWISKVGQRKCLKHAAKLWTEVFFNVLEGNLSAFEITFNSLSREHFLKLVLVQSLYYLQLTIHSLVWLCSSISDILANPRIQI